MSLSKTFDLPTEDVISDLEERIEVIVPENPGIADVARLALESYKIQIQDIPRIEPKYRARAFEVAQAYLAVASDALSNKKSLDLKERALDSKDNKDVENEARIPKSELMDMLSKERKISAVK